MALKLPPMVQQAVVRARAATDQIAGTVAHAVAVAKPAAPDERARRIAICNECPNLNREKGRCRLCGCPLESRSFFERAHCPDNPPRW